VYNQQAKLAGDFLADKIRANTFKTRIENTLGQQNQAEGSE